MQWTKKQFGSLQEALLSAFPGKTELAQMVTIALGENLETIAGGSALAEIVFNLLIWAQSHGMQDELVENAYRRNPYNPHLRAFAEPLFGPPPAKTRLTSQTDRSQETTDALTNPAPLAFRYDVFLSHHIQDRPAVRGIAERLRSDGLRVWFDEWYVGSDEGRSAKIEEGLANSRILVLCISKHAFDSGWSILENQTARFRDPLNINLRFFPLRLENTPVKGALSQLLYIDWFSPNQELEYEKLRNACRLPVELPNIVPQLPVKQTRLAEPGEKVWNYTFSSDQKRALSVADDNTIRLWEIETGECLHRFEGHTGAVLSAVWSANQQHMLSISFDNTVRVWDVQTGRRLRILKGYPDTVRSIVWSTDRQYILSGCDDKTVRLWDVSAARSITTLKGHTGPVFCVLWSANERRVLSGSEDSTIRLWEISSESCVKVLKGHTGAVFCVLWSADQRRALSGSGDTTLRLWETATERCLRVMEGHTNAIRCIAWSTDQQYILSGSEDATIRLWDTATGRCLRVMEGHQGEVCSVAWSDDQEHALSGDRYGNLYVWDLSEFVTSSHTTLPSPFPPPLTTDQIQYTNAKVLIVGETSSGKTGLAHRLITGEWKPSEGSTVGAWSRQWKLPDLAASQRLEREVWLWDFGGQADQRLIHQLYMDHTALILLIFDADKQEVLPGLQDWQATLSRSVPPHTPQFLVAGRIDTGFKADRMQLKSFAEENDLDYYETSAKSGSGCAELGKAIMEAIPWNKMEKRTSPRIFHRIKEEVLKLQAEGQVLLTFKELRELLRNRLASEPAFADKTLETVISLLDSPGALKELDYGTYILLQPEWINTYAQAVIRTLRQDPSELGSLPLRSIAEGHLHFQAVARNGGIEEMQRLPQAEERVILREMERQLEERGLCLRQGDKLVFPSHCGRNRPRIVDHPPIIISYAVVGYLDDIYATLVVALSDSKAFKLKELWRDAADFETPGSEYSMGMKLMRETVNRGEISIYFALGVITQEQMIFANYIQDHLKEHSLKAQRLRHYICPFCGTAKGNPEALMQKLSARGEQATVICDSCDRAFHLWDDLELQFSSDEVRKQVEDLQAADCVRQEIRSKNRLLTLEVAARIRSAGQNCMEIPGMEEEGIRMELEFTDDEGHGTGKSLQLQLREGRSPLRMREADGAEIFEINDSHWVDSLLHLGRPVMLVIGTFAEAGSPFADKDKVADIQWMEIGSYLAMVSNGGKKPVTEIVFKGERLDLASVRHWREKVLKAPVS